MAFDATDFPDPDSPTIARVSPSCRVKLTPRTAETGPANVSNVIVKSSTSKIFFMYSSPSLSIYRVNVGLTHREDHSLIS